MIAARALPLAALLAAACSCSRPPDESADTSDSGLLETVCSDAEALLGYAPCVHRVPDEDTFTAVTIASSSVDQLRVGKYLTPARDDSRLPALFMVVEVFSLHYEFLITAFPDLFAGLSTAEYSQLILYPDTREFYAGTHSLYLDSEGMFYGFTVWDDPSDPSSTVTVDDVASAWEALQARFPLGELYWVPNSSAQLDAAAGWDAPFPIRGLEEVDYEVYNPGEAYGSLRLYTLDELADATEAAEFGYQDILAIDEAPSDLERVVSGIITGTRQGDLSHLNVRSSARGTPNCYLKDPFGELVAWQDTLVRFECGEQSWSIAATTQAEAEAWWDSIRPDPVEVCVPDLAVTTMPGLLELGTDSSEERLAAACAYGSKGANLAVLYQRLDSAYQLDGFLLPFHYYDAFVNENSWTVDLGEGEAEHSFAETIEAWHADDGFLTDAAVRRERLESLRFAMEAAPHDPQLLADLGQRILDVFGSDTVMVRFRSSSNAEDAATFSGAGLYESESACLADSLDDDTAGPSHCDPDKDNEESLEEALGEVWASLWKMQAWDERDWYTIDHADVAMGVLVNTRSKDEQVNAVAFTGNPTSDGDDRYLVNAQLGEFDVVSSEPGVYPEKVLLTLEDGEVTEILRVSESSEVEAGEQVFSDVYLEELAEVLFGVTQVYPMDQEVPADRDLLWDTEWKVLSDGQLIIKQIRPYLR